MVTGDSGRVAPAALTGGGRLSEAEILAQIPAARARGVKASRQGLRAVSARYRAAHEVLYIELTNGTVIGVPLSLVPALRHASKKALEEVEVTPTGSALHWERLDVDLSVPALIRDALGADALRSLFGAEGGRVVSERKAEAARRNGARGGRPPRDGSTGKKPSTLMSLQKQKPANERTR